jgi:uncharacterized protein GlcG (DUF336 family)
MFRHNSYSRTPRRSRRCALESLEERRLLAADIVADAPALVGSEEAGVGDTVVAAEKEHAAALHNAAMPADVNGDGEVTIQDLLLVVDGLRADAEEASPAAEGEASFLDVSGDGVLSLYDVVLVVGVLREMPPQTAGGVLAALNCDGVDDSLIPLATECDVQQLLQRGAAASASENAIIAIVDRGGRILGVRVEQDVLDLYDAQGNGNGMIDPGSAEEERLVFAIDGAVAKARTAAFFANGDGSGGVGPLTSRTVRFISQSTITQREVESNPNILDADSPQRGPGFVGPIGLGGHFPPEIAFTPPVDLFGIEHQSRDSRVHHGLDGIKGTADDIMLDNRFNVPDEHIPLDENGDKKQLYFPESYGVASERLVTASSRGIATLPGGIPLYKVIGKAPILVGGIGVFFPGPDGFATHEQSFVPGVGQTEKQRTNAPQVLESEWIAYAAAGGSSGAGAPVGELSGVAPVGGYDLPFGRIDLVGITLEIYGPHPTAGSPITGVQRLLKEGARVGLGDPDSGADQIVEPGGDMHLDGLAVPDGWLVTPHDAQDGSGLTKEDVEQIIMQGVAEANLVRAAIRVPIGSRTRMVLAVSDLSGNILGLFRMPDATVFSIDVAVAKARNTAYFADAAAIVAADRVRLDTPSDALPITPDPAVPAGAAFTNRTFRFLAEPRFPDGIDGTPPPPFSILSDPGINPATAENLGPPLPASVYMRDETSILAFTAFNPSRNFRDPDDIANQNGVVFFPGSTPLYKNGVLVGGFGVSGDGVDQDDVVTFSGQVGYAAPADLRADRFFVRGVRLPFQKFNRNPRG